ncbi:MAG: hypothetical protein ACKOZW_04550 [Cyanobium sp.]
MKEGAVATGEAIKDGAAATGEAANNAATATGQAALAPAVNPVLDLLKTAEGDIKAGNISGAVTAMGGFEGLW